MKLPIALAQKLLQLLEGESLPASQLKNPITDTLIAEGLIRARRQGRTKCTLSIEDSTGLKNYLHTFFAIPDLPTYVRILKSADASRADLAQAAGDTKIKAVRSFPGFLVNVYEPVAATLNGVGCLLEPTSGRFHFIHDFRKFRLPEAVTVVGVENGENFRLIDRQRHLFEGIQPLFVSRYPQNSSRDLVRWLQAIPNPYLHFGDFDFSGIRIYLNEFRKHLGERARFFIPENFETLLHRHGNRRLYDIQGADVQTPEPGLERLVSLLHQFQKGLEQEVLIK